MKPALHVLSCQRIYCKLTKHLPNEDRNVKLTTEHKIFLVQFVFYAFQLLSKYFHTHVYETQVNEIIIMF